MEGLPALLLWDLVIEVFEPSNKPIQAPKLSYAERDFLKRRRFDMFGFIGFVPPSLPISYGQAKLYILEDNDALITMCIKERSPSMKHMARNHRVNLDWLFERLNRDPAVFMKFVGTKEQSADILTKGSVTAEAWLVSCNLCLIMPLSSVNPRTELLELNYSRACLSLSLSSKISTSMFSKPVSKQDVSGVATSPQRLKAQFAAAPPWATEARKAQGRPVSPGKWTWRSGSFRT